MSFFQNSRFLFILFLGLLLGFSLEAQEATEVERSTNKVILEGKVYYIHVVEPGQTLFAISRAYQVSQKEIAVENPGVVSGLQIGQALKIPVESSIQQDKEPPLEEGTERTHRVKRGETLFSISRKYGLSEQDVLDANPDVAPEELKPGQRVVIPEPGEEEEKLPDATYNEEGYVYYKVKQKDTLYSLAQEYGVTVEDIRAANPELGWGGPEAGQVIRIPQPQALGHPEARYANVGTDSAGQVMDEPEAYFYEEFISAHDNRRRTYHVAFLIPFAFDKPEPLDSLLKDVKSESRRTRIAERYRMEEKEPQSVPFLEFFQGAIMALDSLRDTGMKLEVRFYDTRRSIDRTREILSLPGMEDMDLLIGPFYPFNLELASAFARAHKIPLVTPFYNEMTYVEDNPYLFQPSPLLEDSHRHTARIVASKYDYNIVYVREEDSLDVEKNAFLQEKIFDGFDHYRPQNPVIFKEMVLTLNHSDEILQSLSADRKNLVLVPTRNEALASRVVSTLYYRLKDYDIELIGSPYWTEFASIDYRYYHALGLVFGNPFYLDYLDEDVDAFLKCYRERFYGEPGAMTRKGINYGIVGFDLTMYFVNALKVYGRRFIIKLDEYHPGTVLAPYKFSRVNSSGGYVNRQVSYYQFLPDMSITDFEVPELPEPNYFFTPLNDKRQMHMIWGPNEH